MLGLLAWAGYLSKHKTAFLALAGLSWGLAVGCCQILLVSVGIYALCALAGLIRRPRWLPAALGLLVPLVLCGLALMLYNVLRFGSPLETGFSYQLSIPVQRPFSFAYAPSSLYAYLFYPLQVQNSFPFLRSAGFDRALIPTRGALIQGKLFDEVMHGLMPAFGLAWLAPAGLLAWKTGRNPTEKPENALRPWVKATALAGLVQFLVTICYYYSSMRYTVEFFLPVLLLTAAAVWHIDARLVNRRARRALWWLLVIFLAAWGIILSLSGAFDIPPQIFRRSNPQEYQTVAQTANALAASWQSVLDSSGWLGALLRMLARAMKF